MRGSVAANLMIWRWDCASNSLNEKPRTLMLLGEGVSHEINFACPGGHPFLYGRVRNNFAGSAFPTRDAGTLNHKTADPGDAGQALKLMEETLTLLTNSVMILRELVSPATMMP